VSNVWVPQVGEGYGGGGRTSDHVAHVVWRVSREVEGLGLEVSYVKDLVVFDQVVERPFVIALVDAIALGEALLHAADALADADVGLLAG